MLKDGSCQHPVHTPPLSHILSLLESAELLPSESIDLESAIPLCAGYPTYRVSFTGLNYLACLHPKENGFALFLFIFLISRNSCG